MRTLAALVACAVSALALSASAPSATHGRGVTVDALERSVVTQINSFRRSHGLVALRLSSPLSRAAEQHSNEMARDGYFAHESADGSSFDKRIARYYPSARRAYWSVGENLLWSSPSIDGQGAFQLWLNSPPHRENLLTARWREIGISAVHVAAAPGPYGGHPVTILTADFGVRR
jgi:uncharacterized protein YkwD